MLTWISSHELTKEMGSSKILIFKPDWTAAGAQYSSQPLVKGRCNDSNKKQCAVPLAKPVIWECLEVNLMMEAGAEKRNKDAADDSSRPRDGSRHRGNSNHYETGI